MKISTVIKDKKLRLKILNISKPFYIDEELADILNAMLFKPQTFPTLVYLYKFSRSSLNYKPNNKKILVSYGSSISAGEVLYKVTQLGNEGFEFLELILKEIKYATNN